jgi:hypothetical protein
MAINPRTLMSAGFTNGSRYFNDMRGNRLNVTPKVYAKQSNLQNGTYTFNGSPCFGLIQHQSLITEDNTTVVGSKSNPIFLSKVYFFRKTDMALMGAVLHYASSSNAELSQFIMPNLTSTLVTAATLADQDSNPTNLLPRSIWLTVTNPTAMRTTAGSQNLNMKGQLGVAGDPRPTSPREDVAGANGTITLVYSEPRAGYLKLDFAENGTVGSSYYFKPDSTFYRNVLGQVDFRRLVGTDGEF